MIKPLAYILTADDGGIYELHLNEGPSVLVRLERGKKHFYETGSDDAEIIPLYSMPCQTCTTYRKFIQAMIAEFNKYGANKTAQYYKGQCEKVIKETENVTYKYK